ncbi:hypothetical protein SPHINGO8AM_80213 [Sphingomonas sp. 8AM]|nr:hypothetical protein SPHINGO8AM_80213 [Sphingomonas sp. 8AM]
MPGRRTNDPSPGILLRGADAFGGDAPLPAHHALHADTLLDVIDRHARQLQHIAATAIALQDERAMLAHQQSGFVDGGADTAHRPHMAMSIATRNAPPKGGGGPGRTRTRNLAVMSGQL